MTDASDAAPRRAARGAGGRRRRGHPRARSRSGSSGRATRCSRPTTARRRWELAREARPDLAVLDVMMPKLDGFELTRRLRAPTRRRAGCRSSCSRPARRTRTCSRLRRGRRRLHPQAVQPAGAARARAGDPRTSLSDGSGARRPRPLLVVGNASSSSCSSSAAGAHAEQRRDERDQALRPAAIELIESDGPTRRRLRPRRERCLRRLLGYGRQLAASRASGSRPTSRRAAPSTEQVADLEPAERGGGPRPRSRSATWDRRRPCRRCSRARRPRRRRAQGRGAQPRPTRRVEAIGRSSAPRSRGVPAGRRPSWPSWTSDPPPVPDWSSWPIIAEPPVRSSAVELIGLLGRADDAEPSSTAHRSAAARACSGRRSARPARRAEAAMRWCGPRRPRPFVRVAAATRSAGSAAARPPTAPRGRPQRRVRGCPRRRGGARPASTRPRVQVAAASRTRALTSSRPPTSVAL